MNSVLLNVVRTPLITAVLMSGAITTYADNGVRYDYGSISWVNFDLDSNVDADGFKFTGSHRLDEKFYVKGYYQDIESDFSVGSDALSLGLGYIFPYQHMDIFGQFSFIRADTDVIGSDTGYQLEVGSRGYIEPQFGVYGGFNFVDVYDDTDTFLNIGADYYFAHLYSVGAEISVGGDQDLLALHLRLHLR